MKFRWGLLTLALVAGTAMAEDRLDMQGTEIRGNNELPQVLYIVPWQSPEIPDLSQPPLQSMIDEALMPVDREVFQREIRYHQALSSQAVGDNENQ
jgi:hypothetical protein